mmetsp:Transcript_16699/g.28665  ORF Transcript_16699/g.28665 Transcript_16699/m.28665 type:complete len:127 (-) Transcript_16699:670-1050(-)
MRPISAASAGHRQTSNAVPAGACICVGAATCVAIARVHQRQRPVCQVALAPGTSCDAQDSSMHASLCYSSSPDKIEQGGSRGATMDVETYCSSTDALVYGQCYLTEEERKIMARNWCQLKATAHVH